MWLLIDEDHTTSDDWITDEVIICHVNTKIDGILALISLGNYLVD